MLVESNSGRCDSREVIALLSMTVSDDHDEKNLTSPLSSSDDRRRAWSCVSSSYSAIAHSWPAGFPLVPVAETDNADDLDALVALPVLDELVVEAPDWDT